MNTHLEINLLDTTIRDGSYPINFSYTKQQIKTIVGLLAKAGINWIEMGHGMSIALNEGIQPPRVNDKDSFKIARGLVGHEANIGAVLAPKFARLEKVKQSISELDFVRITVRPDFDDRFINYLDECLNCSPNIKIFIQLLHAHLFDEQKIDFVINKLMPYKPHAIYVVDTLGCMLPEEVDRMILKLKRTGISPVGFHGHNHSALAIANTLQAINSGATYVDATIGGLGRDIGNAQLEVLASLLLRKNKIFDLQFLPLCQLNSYLSQQFPHKLPGTQPVDLLCAHYQLGPVEFPIFKKQAEESDTDICELILNHFSGRVSVD